MVLLHCLMALVVTATSCLQPANAGEGIKPGVERDSAEPQGAMASCLQPADAGERVQPGVERNGAEPQDAMAGFASPRMRAAAHGLSPAPRVWGISSSATWGSAPLRSASPQALRCRLLRRLEVGSHSAVGGGMQGEGVKSNQPPQGKQQGNPPPVKPKPAPTPPVKKETTAQWLLRFLGISATPSAMKGEGDKFAGDIWLADSTTQTSERITRQGGFRSPILLAGDAKLLALKGDSVVEIAIESGEVKPRQTIPGIVKLIGVNAADANQVLFLREEGQRVSVGALLLNEGRIEPPRALDPDSEDDRRMLAHLRGWERVYDGGKTVVYTKTETKEGLAGPVEWRDVYLKREGRDTVNVSNCDGVNCGQPSASQNGRWVAYVKAAQ